MDTTRSSRFKLIFILILILGFILRVVPALNNNFYFTMDQADTALHVREILQRGKIPLIGAATSIEGFHSGPIWYWFAAIGYALFQGHPFGGNFMLILINLAISAILMKKIAQNSASLALFTGFSLQLFWSFYNTSRYAFSPFPLAFLYLSALILIIEVFEGKKNFFILTAIPIGLTYHSEVASFPPLFIFFTIVGLWLLRKRKIDFPF